MDSICNFMGKHWMQNMTWMEVESYLKEKDSVIIPMGQVEQHGPHLPMGNDTYVAIGIAESISQKTGILIAPPVWIGYAPRMVAYPGSFTFSAATLEGIITDMCKSLVTHGFKRIYIINGHRRENLPPMEIATTKVRYETGALIAILDPTWLGVDVQMSIREGNKNILSHACGMETAQLMHIAPELVKEEEFRDTPEEGMLNVDEFMVDVERVKMYDLPEEFRKLRGERGVRGCVTWATAARGKQYHDAVVEGCIRYIEKTKDVPVTITKPSPIV